MTLPWLASWGAAISALVFAKTALLNSKPAGGITLVMVTWPKFGANTKVSPAAAVALIGPLPASWFAVAWLVATREVAALTGTPITPAPLRSCLDVVSIHSSAAFVSV